MGAGGGEGGRGGSEVYVSGRRVELRRPGVFCSQEEPMK